MLVLQGRGVPGSAYADRHHRLRLSLAFALRDHLERGWYYGLAHHRTPTLCNLD